MPEVPFWPTTSGRQPSDRFSVLEAQLEIVLERDGVPISVAPARPTMRPATPVDEVMQADQHQVRILQQARAAKRPKPVAVEFSPHEPSRFLVRMQGTVARPKRDVREPFHQTMHHWQTPFVEGVGMERVFVEASDLWVEALDPRFFHDQFTPGDLDEAYRESRRSLWARLRQPFVRWDDRRQYASVSLLNPSTVEYQDIITSGDDSSREEQLIAQLDLVDQAEARAPFGDTFEEAPTPAFFPAAFAPEQEAMLPEIAAMPPQAEEPTNHPWHARWSNWRERARETVADAHEQEQTIVEEAQVAWHAPYLEPRLHVTRIFVGFLGALCLVAVPAGAVSWSRSVSQSVRTVQTTANSLLVSTKFDSANTANATSAFTQIEHLTRDIEQSHGIALALAQALPTTRTTAQTVQALLDAGQEASQAGSILSQGFTRALASDISLPDERLVRLTQYLAEARPHLERVFAAAERIHPEALPTPDAQAKAQQIQQVLLSYKPLFRQMDALAQLALPLLGHNEPRTYLILFQNPAERRPSGGFMGSYAQVVIDRGVIKKLDVPGGGPYDLRSQLRVRWEAPAPLQLVGARWEFQDANWSADFAETASTVRTFWSKAGQPTLDGVIAINATILPKLLTVTGPIEMPTYGKTVTSENVLEETQKAVELEYDREENKPKAFIGDLNREVMKRLQNLSQDQWVPLLTVLASALETKDMQIALVRPEEQAAVRAFGWTGEWPTTDEFDQLALIGANIAGQKTSQVIDEAVNQAVTINEQGFVQTNLQLVRDHTGTAGALFNGTNNVEYLRVYTPASSQLLGANGFQTPASTLFERPTATEEPFPGLASTTTPQVFQGQTVDVSQDAGRQIFGGWVQLQPGAHATTAFQYRLPRSTQDMARALAADTSISAEEAISDAYVLRLISQSGAARSHHLVITYPASWRVQELSPGLTLSSPGQLSLDIPALTQDALVYALFSRSETTKP